MPDFSDEKTRAAGGLALAYAAEILSAHGAEWWIEAGTCLACVREGGRFIRHDQDIDLGILDGADFKSILRDFDAVGFETYRHYGSPGRGEEWTFRREGVKLDLFVFSERGMRLEMGCWRDGKMIPIVFHRDLILPTFMSRMEGVDVPMPNRPQDYLEARYGKDWRIPRKDWRWDIDPPAIDWKRSEISKQEILKLWPRTR